MRSQDKKKRTWPGGMRRRDDVNFDRELQALGAPGLPEKLPLAHVTCAWSAKEIIRSGQIQASSCEVFDKDLLYFFVLRPAYRMSNGTIPSDLLSECPVVFIVRPEAVETAPQVYPFDTGAAAKGAFASRADKKVPLEDYELESLHAAAGKFIAWAFGSLTAYFDGQLRDGIDNDAKGPVFAIVSYLRIARMGIEGSNKPDKRASTVELASSRHVDLNRNLSLMIVPKQFLESDKLVEKIKGTGAEYLFYNWQPNRAPDEFQRELFDIARNWYIEKGIMP